MKSRKYASNAAMSLVAPFVGAWIEIICNLSFYLPALSLPSWERGLKSLHPRNPLTSPLVAPFVGAWIEIFDTCIIYKLGTVAPFVGAWIEIHEHSTHWAVGVSLPSWERGLKFCQAVQVLSSALVAPFVGAWIEILQ